MSFENKLYRLFELQKFAQNKRLEALIKETERVSEAELSDEAMSLVSAAGDVAQAYVKKEEPDDD